jgi:hypothetical protein
VCDVIFEAQDIYGDHVNIAARVEQLAQPGGILISAGVRHYVHDRVGCLFHDLGQQQLRNIAHPVHVFQILLTGSDRKQVVPALKPQASEPGDVPQLHLFGPVSLRIGKQDVPLRNLKSRALLGYVALGELLRETRERLVGLLWSESSEERARAVLRQVVRELRGRLEAAGCFGLHFGPYEVGIDPDAIHVDVFEVLKAADLGEVHPLLLERRHLTEELLAGLEDVDPAFRAWLVAKRARMSVDWPAGKGTTMRSGLVGQAWARAGSANATGEARISLRENVIVGSPRWSARSQPTHQ